MKIPVVTLLSLALAPLLATAQDVTTEPIGFNKITCLVNSDTIVGVPLRKQGSFYLILSAITAGSDDSVTLTFPEGSLTAAALKGHYLKFIDGPAASRWYDIKTNPLNTTSTLTISLNGDSVGGTAAIGNKVLIAEYWTLDTLFPPASATTSWTETPVGSGNWVQNGHCVIASTSTLATGRKTEILMPNVTSPGYNIPAEGKYYIHYSASAQTWIWKRDGSGNANYGAVIRFYPDTMFTIRHPSTTGMKNTIFRNVGEVEMTPMTIPLTTQNATKQDNFVAIPRPLPVTLEGLNLRQSPGAFMSSSGTLATTRRDEIFVYNNDLQLRNKAPSARYYVHGGIWKQDGGGNTDRGSVVIPASSGFIIRKYQVAGGLTSFWNNTTSY